MEGKTLIDVLHRVACRPFYPVLFIFGRPQIPLICLDLRRFGTINVGKMSKMLKNLILLTKKYYSIYHLCTKIVYRAKTFLSLVDNESAKWYNISTKDSVDLSRIPIIFLEGERV